MDEFSAYKYNQLKTKSTSNESLNSNSSSSSVVLEEDDHKTIELAKAYKDQEPSKSLNSNVAFDKVEVNESKEVHIGNNYNCASVHVYESASSSNYFKVNDNSVTKIISQVQLDRIYQK